MLKQPQSKFSSIKPADKPRLKLNQKNPPQAKSHIVFAGDPTFHEESFDYIPVGRRKKIFEDNQSKILPPDLLVEQDGLMQHNRMLTNQRLIAQNIAGNFDRNFLHKQGSGHYIAHQQTNRKFKSSAHKEQTYFEPNNLEADMNFGIIQEEDHNHAFNSSKASETTQKKGGVAFQSQAPHLNMFQRAASTISTGRAPTNTPAINFSYMGKEFPKVSDQVIESQVQTRIPSRSNHISSPKSHSRTIFLNEGGVMVPKTKKIPIQDSNYFDFQGDNSSYHEYNPLGNGWTNVVGSEGIKQGETPEFSKFPGENNNVLSNELINQSLINQFNRLESEQNLSKLNDGKNQYGINQNNNSAISYKSIQKQFQLEKEQTPNPNDQPPIPKPQEKEVIKILDQIGNPTLTKNEHSASMSFQEQRQSMFDQLLKDRQKIFNKNKIQHEPQLPSPSQPQQRRISDNGTKRPNNNTSMKTIINNDGGISELGKSIQKPADFITDSSAAPKGVKRNIGISNVTGNDYEKVKHSYQHEALKNETNMLESKVKKVQVGAREHMNNQIDEANKQIQTQKNRSRISQKSVKPNQPSLKQPIKSQFSQENKHVNFDEKPLNDDQEEQRDLMNESQDEESSSNQKIQYKRRKRDKVLKRNAKNRKKTVENDSQLEDFLQQQKQTIHLKQIGKYMEHVPVIRQALNMNKQGKSKGKLTNPQRNQEINHDYGKAPVVVDSFQMLTPQQKELLVSAGIKIFSSSQFNPQNMSNSTTNMKNPMDMIKSLNQSKGPLPNQQFPQDIINTLVNQSVNNNRQGHYMSHQNQLYNSNRMEEQMAGGIIGMMVGSQKKGNGSQQQSGNQYSQVYQNSMQPKGSQLMEHKFDELNKMLYNELAKFLSSNSNTQKINQTFNNPVRPQIGSTITFSQNLNPSTTNINSSPNIINPNRPQSNPPHQLQDQGIQVNISPPKQHHHRNHRHIKSSQDQNLYSPKIYNELKKFNQENNQHNNNSYQNNSLKRSYSKQRNMNLRDSVSDQSHYYSFYHEDNPQTMKIATNYQPRTHFIVDSHSYYPMKQMPRRKYSPSQRDIPSLKSKYDIRSNKFSSSFELEHLFKKIQQLTKEIHEQLPLIRQQIEQNQQEIRKIQTNLLIKNTAQQHNLIKILQKMKIKDTQLKQKQLEVHNRDQELSMYQDELDSLKHQFYQKKQIAKDLEMENFFQNRLQKIRNYNQTLCSKIAYAKVTAKKTTASIL